MICYTTKHASGFSFRSAEQLSAAIFAFLPYNAVRLRIVPTPLCHVFSPGLEVFETHILFTLQMFEDDLIEAFHSIQVGIRFIHRFRASDTAISVEFPVEIPRQPLEISYL